MTARNSRDIDPPAPSTVGAQVTDLDPADLAALGRTRMAALDFAGAREAYAAALRTQPHDPIRLLDLANAEWHLGDLQAAEVHARASAQANPSADALLLLGLTLSAQHRVMAALNAFAQGAQLAPRDARFPYHRAVQLDRSQHYAQAAAAYAHALHLNPRMMRALAQWVFVKRRLYDWQGLPELSAQLCARADSQKPGIAPFIMLAEESGPDRELRCARAHAATIEAASRALREQLRFRHPSRPNAAPLRIGMVLGGFGLHPSALLIVAVLEALCEFGVEVHCFVGTPDDGHPLRRRIAACTTLHDIASLNDGDAARAIHATGCEVLLDLDGWSDGDRSGVLALRPAPLQVNWLGYPGTSGAPWIDYAIADAFVLPESLRPHFSESIARLPRCYQPSDPTRAVDEPPPRAAFGLPESGIVFASFNNSYKLNATSHARMCEVLSQVPGGTLWLLDAGAEANSRLCEATRTMGIDPRRVVFAPKLSHARHLARHRHVDLFLDTNPYNAHTTASDALWAGCPVLTRPGDTFASRVAGSLNHHLGMDTLNAHDDAAFVAKAVELAREPGALDALRLRLERRKRESDLFDMRGYARDFAATLRAMAARHRTGQAPADIG